MPESQTYTLSIPVVMLAVANAVLFAVGALLHSGVPIGPIEESVNVAVTGLEAIGGLLLVLATIGLFTAADWSRRLARFANTFAIASVAAVAMLLALDDDRSAAPVKAMQVLRVLFASVSLLLLYHNGRNQAAG